MTFHHPQTISFLKVKVSEKNNLQKIYIYIYIIYFYIYIYFSLCEKPSSDHLMQSVLENSILTPKVYTLNVLIFARIIFRMYSKVPNTGSPLVNFSIFFQPPDLIY